MQNYIEHKVQIDSVENDHVIVNGFILTYIEALKVDMPLNKGSNVIITQYAMFNYFPILYKEM